MPHAATHFIPLHIAILTVSDTRNLSNDSSGAYLAQAATDCGHQVFDRQICTDDIYQIRAIVSQWIVHSSIGVVLITGGTGFYDRDVTPEAVAILFDKHIDGFGEMFRHLSAAEIGLSTMQSRAIAGLANHTAIFCLPGSTNACKTAWQQILQPQLDAQTKPCNFVPHLKKANRN